MFQALKVSNQQDARLALTLSTIVVESLATAVASLLLLAVAGEPWLNTDPVRS